MTGEAPIAPRTVRCLARICLRQRIVTTIAAFKVYGEVLLHPEQISAKFDSWLLALIAA